MSETRRQLFKTSVMSALGLTTVATLTACDKTRQLFLGKNLADTNPPIILGYSSSTWYIFSYDATQSSYLVFKLLTAAKAPKCVSPDMPFDNERWFESLLPADIQAVNSLFSFSIGPATLHFSFNGSYLDPGSATNLINHTHQNTGSWNEIGHK